MANFTRLNVLTPNRSDWRVLVRVEKMWDTLEADVGEGLSFLFVDEMVCSRSYNAPTAPPGESPTPSLWAPRPISARGPHPCPTAGPLFLRGSNDLFTIPAINTRPFPVFWPHSHGFGNHFPKGHPSFNYSSPSTLNSGVTYRPLTEKGTKMHAFVEQSNQMKRFKRCLHEGEWKILTGFSVVMVNTEIRLTEARNKIALTSNTSVTPAEDSDAWIPLDIVPYDYVSNFWNDERTSFPRGKMSLIPRNPLNDDPKTTNTIDFTLQDNDGDQIQCRVKGALASKFKRFWLYYGKIETIVCLLTDWRVVEDADPIHIESEEGISRFEFNPIGFDEVDHFTEIMCSSSQDSSEEEC
ncbi:unnamed protein product [Microthlaspi erraticum]|uniref:Replication protein A 70 kDa DNA-binding subunit B/D first OB fold domain-containing protein n=1 Tax=Microthlaspi erraticum TaxID=1685480 RepID=A0A6D2L4F1_9BRAS|nr:unnamed protein product [Microthlaspi erraticum]